MKVLKNQKGFTLIELMVVIVIIGILSAVAVPKFMGASAKAKMAEVPPVVAAFEHAELAYIAETGNAGAIDDIIFEKPTDSKWFQYDDLDASNPGSIKASATSVIGAFPSGGVITSTINTTTNTFAHGFADGTTDAAQTAARKMLPNFFPAAAAADPDPDPVDPDAGD